MVMERADIAVVPGQETEFETAMTRGCALLFGAPGCTAVSLLRCVERPSRYALHIEWNSVTDHRAFTKTTDFLTFRDLVGPYFVERPAMEHFQQVLPGS
jgi:heme-degrading monooxygenase HmoA